jgi:ABC-2 type transport system permease protein
MSTGPRPSQRSGAATLTAAPRLAHLILRRDRVRLAIWFVAIVGLVATSAASLPPLYPDQASIEQYVALASGNPALQAFAGPGAGFDDPNIGVILVNEVQLWGAVTVALMAIFLLVRHTRAEEDDERADLVRSGVVGRHAPLAAALVVVGAEVVVLSAVLAVCFVAFGYELVGSLALAASLAAAGLAFLGVAAVAAQVAGSARGALGLSSAVLGASFALRAAGDAGAEWLRWTSPLGWAQSGRPFADERWWPLVLCLALALVLVLVARSLADRRDLGSGLVASHGGPATAAAWIRRPVGLALRLQRWAIVGWSVGFVLFGALYGSIGDEIATFIEDNPVYADLVAQQRGVDLTDSFFASAAVMMALMACGFAISSVLRLRAEERSGRADLLLAGPLSRTRWALGQVTVAVGGSVLLLALAGAGMGAGYGTVIGDLGQIARLAGAALVMVPGVLVLGGGALALYGLAPRAALAAWGGLGAVFVIGFFGELLGLPALVRDLSPFTHLPAAPAVAVTWAPVLAVSAVAVGLGAAGLWGLRRRDLAAS